MSMRLAPALLVAVLLAGCASNLTPPSLAPRAAEKIDPRIPVVDNSAALLADPALVAELRAAEARARSAAAAAEPAIAAARNAVGGAGARESESWIAAQEVVSAAVAARGPFTAALGDFDRLVASRIQSGTRLVPKELAEARTSSAALAAIDQRQGEELAALQRQLR